ncbi:glycosyltransferase [uncultured Cyclobacterium sp.]|uniref:glycosyltransferase n=1 Tax=uncultured Cyclobacterium sp. TaxID=453820 RepID=UPI0030EB5497
MGKIELEESGEFQVDIHPHQKYKWLDTVGKLIKIPFLDQQVRALSKIKDYDLIYMPYPISISKLFTFFKFFGLLKVPVVGLAHQNFIYYKNKNSILNKVGVKHLRQIDAFAFFSKNLMLKTQEDLKYNQLEKDNKCFSVSWGADVDFYKNIETKRDQTEVLYAVCAGTADRDYDILIKAFENIPINLKIYCTPNTIPASTHLPPNVFIDTSWVPYDQLLEEYVNSSFIIIPLKEEIREKGNTYGLTVLLDAMAVGKPVLMTQHSFLDIDIQSEKIGLWVYDNTPEGWSKKLLQMVGGETDLDAMGKRAKQLHLEKYNIRNFANQMANVFKTVLSRRR